VALEQDTSTGILSENEASINLNLSGCSGINLTRMLGHSNISTTQRSMHVDDRELAEAQDLVE
jgi:site-specific recombinase XerC